MEGTRMDRAVMPICGKEFWKGVAEVVVDKWGDDIFVAEWNDKEMASPHSVEVVLPARTGVSARLGVSRGWHLVFLILYQLLDCHVLIRDLSVQDHGQLLVVRRILQGMRHLTDRRYVGERDPRRRATKLGVILIALFPLLFGLVLFSVQYDNDHG